jgi:type 1 glutamine amidotransferase
MFIFNCTHAALQISPESRRYLYCRHCDKACIFNRSRGATLCGPSSATHGKTCSEVPALRWKIGRLIGWRLAFILEFAFFFRGRPAMLKSIAGAFALAIVANVPAGAEPARPVKILIVSGGCCHDYAQQRKLLEAGLKERMAADVSHLYHDPKPGEKATRPALPIYGNPRYADGFDVVIHNECAADEDSAQALDAVLAPHRAGKPAVNLHCAMHSYRSGEWKKPVTAGAANARWFEFTGIQSSGHGPQSPIQLSATGQGHPIAAGFQRYTTASDELYNNLTTFDVTPVLYGVQPESPVAADRTKTYVVAWTHHYGPQRARVFSTTLAHNEAVMADPRYLDFVARGVLWAVGRL